MDKSSDDVDMKELFSRIAGHFANADEGSRGMFGMLVDTALKYRDMLVKSTGVPLTVQETRDALDAFMQVLNTRKIPQSLDKRIHNLVILWLDELKTRVHH